MDKKEKKRERTDEAKARTAAKTKAKHDARKAATEALLGFAKENCKDASLLEAIKVLTPGAGRGAPKAPGAADAIRKALLEGKAISEEKIWSEHKLGRVEMRRICVGLIKKAEPRDRVWVSFDPETGMYEVKGKGAKEPRNWTGYVPVEIEDLPL